MCVKNPNPTTNLRRSGRGPDRNFVPSKSQKELLSFNKKSEKLTQLLNRTRKQVQTLKNKIYLDANSERKAQARTKIQLGGLLIKSKLAELVGIEIGEDLQLDPKKWDQAALILSLLTEVAEKLPTLSDAERQEHINRGALGLKYDFLPES